MRARAICVATLLTVLPVTSSPAQDPKAITAAAGEVSTLTVHAEGAQVYECKIASSGKLTWQFREPIAALLADGKTVGRHYVGRSWEHMDGSLVTAKVVGRAPGTATTDIPLLKLEVNSQGGVGALTGSSTILRVNTRGGLAEGACEQAGSFLSVPYSADYVFFRKAG